MWNLEVIWDLTSDVAEVADDIDRLITLDLDRRRVVRILYDAARQKMEKPLVLAASDVLHKVIAPGSVVLVATGWPDRPWITPAIGELDGLPGAALLGRSVHDAADAGFIDGNTGYVTPRADRLSTDTHATAITMLRRIVGNALSPRGLARER